MESLTDEVLALRVQNGDNESFQELYNRYRGMLFGYILNMVRDYNLAEDMLQETFYKVLSRIQTFNGSNFQVWIFSIARHLVIDYWKKLKVRNRHNFYIIEGQEFKDGEWSNPQTRVMDAEMLNQVNQAIDKLPVKLKEPLVMHTILGMDYDEISRLTGINSRTLKVRIFRARKKLLKMLEGII